MKRLSSSEVNVRFATHDSSAAIAYQYVLIWTRAAVPWGGIIVKKDNSSSTFASMPAGAKRVVHAEGTANEGSRWIAIGLVRTVRGLDQMMSLS